MVLSPKLSKNKYYLLTIILIIISITTFIILNKDNSSELVMTEEDTQLDATITTNELITPEVEKSLHDTTEKFIKIEYKDCTSECIEFNAIIFEDGKVLYQGIEGTEMLGTYLYTTTDDNSESFSMVEDISFEFENSNMRLYGVDDSEYLIEYYDGTKLQSVILEDKNKELSDLMDLNLIFEMSYISGPTSSPDTPYSFFAVLAFGMKGNVCFGSCGVYEALVFADGRIIFFGENNVKYLGYLEFFIESTEVNSIVNQIYESDFNNIDKLQMPLKTDIPSITLFTNSNQLNDYGYETPQAITDLRIYIWKILDSNKLVCTSEDVRIRECKTSSFQY